MNVSAWFRSSSEGEAGAGPALGGAALARLRARGDLPLFTWRQQMRMEPGVGYVHECIRPTRFLCGLSGFVFAKTEILLKETYCSGKHRFQEHTHIDVICVCVGASVAFTDGTRAVRGSQV